MKSAESPHVILVVDDEPVNIRRVVECLGGMHRILSARSGKQAFKVMEKEMPDLVLLDISMPGMDGYEMCERLKADPGMRGVPVIFLTGMSGQENEFKGLRHGAVDYITKPFPLEILRARVETHLALKLARERLQNYNYALEAQVELRTQELREAHERLKVLDRAKLQFLDAIAHELRTPANGVLGLAEIALWELARYQENSQMENAFFQSKERLIRMIESAEFLVGLQFEEHVKEESVEVLKIMEFGLYTAEKDYHDFGVPISCDIKQGKVCGCERLLRFAIKPLFGAGIKLSSRGEPLRVSGCVEGEHYTIDFCMVSDPIPQAVLDRFFDLGSEHRSASQVEELGLSIPVAYEVICWLGGSVSIKQVDQERGWYCMTVMLPLAQSEDLEQASNVIASGGINDSE